MLLNSAQANWQSGRFMAGGHVRGDGMVSRRSRGRKIQASHGSQEGRARSVVSVNPMVCRLTDVVEPNRTSAEESHGRRLI